MATPQSKHYKIVALKTKFLTMPKFALPPGHTYELVESYDPTNEELLPLIADADIVITPSAPLTAEILSPEATPKLKLLQVIGTGTDAFDLNACKARGVTVCNLAGGNTQTVAEHALAGYFACRRSHASLADALRRGEWTAGVLPVTKMRDGDGMPPLTCKEETAAFFGFGAIGTKLASIVKALGMKVMVAEHKGRTSIGFGRVSFQKALESASVLFICLPRCAETMNLISRPEFAAMRRQAVLVNVSRGGIVDEDALLHALREKQIAGAATDVFATEPAGPSNSKLLTDETRGFNLVVTPHTAWFSQTTYRTFDELLIENLAAWCLRKPVRVVV